MSSWTAWLHDALNPRDCDCPPGRDCTCDAIRGRDTDFDDTFNYQRPDGTVEPARGKWWLGGRCSLACGDVECPPCRAEELHKADQLPPAPMPWLNGPPPGEDRAMPAHIPPGREHLWRRQDEADAEVRRLTALYEAATKKADRLNTRYPAYSPQVRDADAEAERINTEVDRAEAVAERIYQERTAGLSSWIDHDPTAPICTECGGTGGPPGSDAHTSCRTCRGWGREDDGRPPIPAWSDEGKQWINPATGRPVDLLADEAPPARDDHGPDTWTDDDEARDTAKYGQPPAKPSPTPSARPSTAPTTTSGAAMSSAVSYGSLKARILGIAENTLEQQGPLQQAIGGLDEQIAAAQAANEESQALTETIGTLMQARQHCEDALGMVHQANTGATNAAAGLQ